MRRHLRSVTPRAKAENQWPLPVPRADAAIPGARHFRDAAHAGEAFEAARTSSEHAPTARGRSQAGAPEFKPPARSPLSQELAASARTSAVTLFIHFDCC